MDGLTAFRITGGRTFEQARSVEIVDQLLLPHTVQWETVSTVAQAFAAIKSMKVCFITLTGKKSVCLTSARGYQIRGAPAIASLAALGIAAELLEFTASTTGSSPVFPATLHDSPAALYATLDTQLEYLLTSRPTAVNLLAAVVSIRAVAQAALDAHVTADAMARRVVDAAVQVWSEDKARNIKIGDHGAAWILAKLEREGTIQPGEKISVLTVSAVIGSMLRLQMLNMSCSPPGLQHWIPRDFCMRLFSSPVLNTWANISKRILVGIWNCHWCHHITTPPGPYRARLLLSDWPLPTGCPPHITRNG